MIPLLEPISPLTFFPQSCKKQKKYAKVKRDHFRHRRPPQSQQMGASPEQQLTFHEQILRTSTATQKSITDFRELSKSAIAGIQPACMPKNPRTEKWKATSGPWRLEAAGEEGGEEGGWQHVFSRPHMSVSFTEP